MKPKLNFGVLFVVFVLVACKPANIFPPTITATPSPTSTPILIERERAIQNAIQACNPSYGLQPMESPTETKAELTTCKKVDGCYSSDPEKPVWVVKMKGRWLLVGGPAPDPSDLNPQPSYWDACTIIIDAKTGESLSLPIE